MGTTSLGITYPESTELHPSQTWWKTLAESVNSALSNTKGDLSAVDAALQAGIDSLGANIFGRGEIASGTDLNNVRTLGLHTVKTSGIASSLINWPFAGYPGWVLVLPASNGALLQIAFCSTSSQRKWVQRQSVSVTLGTMTEWETVWDPNATSPAPIGSSDAGLTNSLLVQDWSRRMGGRKKVTTATLALRFDHGLANFLSKIKAELDARNFKYSLALCSGQWGRAENVGVTPEMVNSWVLQGRAEIWNHSKDHGSGDNSEAQWKAAILDGLTELRAQIPAAQIDGFAPPGTAGTNFGGFINGNTPEQFYATDGGRFILSHHAVSAGYIGASARWQDGTPRQGLGHYTIDKYTLGQVQTLIQGAQSGKRAVQFMLHPSLIDTTGYITTAEFVSILAYVKTEVDAGRLTVVSPYEQLLTDAV